jgi:hypothetical protein
MFTASTLYGATPQAPSYAATAAPTQAMAHTDDISTGVRGLFDLNNPLVWFGVILLVTVGAAGAAGSVRLGKAKFSASVDKG